LESGPTLKEIAMRTSLVWLVVAMGLVLCTCGPAAADPASAAPAAPEAVKADSGDTAWMLISTGLVLLMVPGLALFYGGMVRRKNVLGTMMHSMVALAIIGIQWVLFGYALAFGASRHGLIGWSFDLLGLHGVSPARIFPETHIPVFVHCMYQGMFAIITPALISGAMAERIRFGPYCLFILLWATLVYDPLAHWVWAVDDHGQAAGWLGRLGALDFAGGTVVHVAAGLSGLAAILVLRKRIGYPEHAIHPNGMVLTLVGAGLLWFGWFGFNGGSALAASGLAGSALTASQVAAAAAALGWMAVEWRHRGKPTALGLASGLVAGLVAVTPAAGFVTPLGALAIGLTAGVVCYVAVCLKPLFRYDDSLDAFGVHGVGGFLGAVLTGVFASAALYKAGSGNSIDGGWLFDGRFSQVGIQLAAAVAAGAYSFLATLLLVVVIDRVLGFCLAEREENEGLDRIAHGEVGFDLGLALESVPEKLPHEPRPADEPPDRRKRFTLAVEGADERDLIHVWSGLCQAGAEPPPAEFRAVYPYVTTVRGNRFRFRGGEPDAMRGNLEQLLRQRLKDRPLRVQLEP
jgi:Amt family ammonium transporter